jgi:hypothetical protein
VHGHVMMHGAQPHAGVSRLGLEERHRDGANLYQYLGSAPYEASDPLGLYMWGDNLDTMVVGVSAFTLLAQLSETHLFVQNELIDWATDMSRGDDEIHDINAIGYAASSNGDAQVDALAGPYAQHIQATRGGGLGRMAAGAARRGGGLSARLQVPFNQWLNKGPRNVEVYVRKNSKTGAYEYVGITNDHDRRQREHGAELKKVADNLTRNEARALEQLLMDTNPHFMSAGSNQNASISSRNPQFNMARQWAQAYVQQHGTRTRWR